MLRLLHEHPGLDAHWRHALLLCAIRDHADQQRRKGRQGCQRENLRLPPAVANSVLQRLRYRPVRVRLALEFVDEGDKKKWLGNGQICAGGCCPCMHNKGDWGEISAETDGSTPEKYGSLYAVSPFWPPCITNTVVFHLTQKGVGPPNKKGGSPAIVEMAR